MKKIYLLMMGLVSFVVTTRAQSICPNGTEGRALPVQVNSNTCLIFLTEQWPNSPILLLDENLNQVPYLWLHGNIDSTDVNGTAIIYIDCNVNPEPKWSLVCNSAVANQCCQSQLAPKLILPVKLISFTGRLKTDNSVTLDWASAIEEESSQYEVQRSVDGKNYEKVGILKAAGNSTTAIKYTFEDHLPASGAYYYRLKQIDNDGKFEYSKVVYVNSKKGSGIVTKVFPNPFKGEVQLIGATSSDLTPNNIHVFSISGQRIQYRIVGANSILIDPSAPDGVYILQVKDQRFKLVKNPSGTSY